MQNYPKKRRSRSQFVYALLACFIVAPNAIMAKNPGDSVFSGLQVHRVNVKFDQPWSVVEPILKANKEKEIYIAARLEINCIPAGHPGCVVMDSVGVRHKGNSTFNQTRAKNPFRFSFDEYGIDQRWDGLKGIALHNAFADPSHMNEKIHLDFLHKAGIVGPRSNYAWLYINDTLFSFYSLVELPDKRLLQTHYGENDGDLFKANDLVGGGSVSDFVRREPYDSSAYTLRFECKSDSTHRAWGKLVRFIDTLNLATDITATLPRIANVNALYRAFGTDNLFGNTDSYMQSGQNYLFYFPEVQGPMQWIVWDVSLSMVTTGTARTLIQANKNRPLANRIMDTPALREDYVRALWFLYKAHFAGNWLTHRIDTVAQFIRPHIAADTRSLTTLAAFETDVETLKKFITGRQTYAEGATGFAATEHGAINDANAIRTGDIVINELDPTQGWIEVHNTRTYSIDLSGHTLSDKADAASPWVFPLGSFVEPGSYRVIALKGGNPGTLGNGVAWGNVGLSGPTDFALPATGGSLRLARANKTVVDSVLFGAQTGTRSLSRFGNTFAEGVATPGLPNLNPTGLPAALPPKSVVINEFMAENDTLVAPAGIKADWVELYNTTSAPVSLAGLYLSDNDKNPTKWQFPAGTTIAANGYLVVWAYDTTFPGAVHASWALSRSQESIRLSNADFSMVDSLTYGEQSANRTMARIPNGSGAFQTSCFPTLGIANQPACGGADIHRSLGQKVNSFELLSSSAGRIQIRFHLSSAGSTRLTVHDLHGHEIAHWTDTYRSAGLHQITTPTASLPRGMAIFRLQSNGVESTRTGVLAR